MKIYFIFNTSIDFSSFKKLFSTFILAVFASLLKGQCSTPSILCQTDTIVYNGPEQCGDGEYIQYTLPSFTSSCPVAPVSLPGFTTLGLFGKNTYYVSNGMFTGGNAFNNAVSNGGFVATIPNGIINAQMVAALQEAGVDNALIGLRDVVSEGNFGWHNGDSINYTNWSPGEPNNFNNDEDYVRIRANGSNNIGKWNDIPNSFQSRYILVRQGGIGLISGIKSGGLFPQGLTQNTFAVVDSVENSDTCSFSITLLDTLSPPTILRSSDTIISVNPCDSGVVVHYSLPTFSVPCGYTSFPDTGFVYLGKFGNKNYHVSSYRTTGDSAFDQAVALGGFVATIPDSAVNAEIVQALLQAGYSSNVWIGLNSLQINDVFFWHSNEGYAYRNWAAGEVKIEYYVNMLPDGKWRDVPKFFPTFFILETKGNLEQIAGLPSGSVFPKGTTANTFVITDNVGRSDTCSFLVTIDADTTVSTISCLDYNSSSFVSDYDVLLSWDALFGSGPYQLEVAEVGNPSNSTQRSVIDTNFQVTASPGTYVWSVAGNSAGLGCPSCTDTFTVACPNITFSKTIQQPDHAAAAGAFRIFDVQNAQPQYDFVVTDGGSNIFSVNDKKQFKVGGILGGHYTVTVTDDFGCSATDSFTILTLDTTYVPELITVNNAAGCAYTVVWDTVGKTGLKGYQASYRPKNGGARTLSPQLSSATASHTFGGLTAGTTYSFYVRSRYDIGNGTEFSPWSGPKDRFMPSGCSSPRIGGGSGNESHDAFVIGNLAIFPNPVEEVLNISSTGGISEVLLLDAVGKLVYHKRLGDACNTEIEMANFAKGVYLLKVIEGEKIYTERVIRE